jgi:hypothetical protein
LRRAGPDEHGAGSGQAARQRGHREHRQPDQQRAARTDHVGEPATQDHQATEDEGVGGHHPGQSRAAQLELRADARERDLHDRDVDDQHELGGSEQRQQEPAPLSMADRHLVRVSHRDLRVSVGNDTTVA